MIRVGTRIVKGDANIPDHSLSPNALDTTGASTGDVPTVQSDGSVELDTPAGGVALATSGTPAPLGSASRGSGTTAARSDHVHAMPTAAAGGTGAVTGVTASGGTGSVTGSTDAGSSHTHAGVAFNPAVAQIITGTGFATAGQVITTTGPFVAAANDYAGAMFLSATGTPCIVVSHPEAAAGPLVLTVFGAAPATAADAWKLYRAPTPVVAAENAHTHAAGSLAGPSHNHEATGLSGPSHTHTLS